MKEIKRLTLPAYGFAKKLDAERRQLLAICGQFCSFDTGDIIVNEHEVKTDLFLVLEGSLVLRRRISDHSYAPVGTANRGSTFGELNLFHPLPARTTVLAMTSGELWRLSKVQFEAMVADDLVIAREVLGYLCTSLALRLRRATQRYANTKEEYDQLFDEMLEGQQEEVVSGEAEAPAATTEG